MGKNKVYAVRRGHAPGIYNDWATCQAAVSGFPGAQFKSFATLAEAQAYLGGAGGGPPPQQHHHGHGAAAPPAPAPAAAAAAGAGGAAGGLKWWAVVRGRTTGVFESNWDRVRPLVTGFPSALYKSFGSREAAQAFFAAGSSSSSSHAAGGAGPASAAHAGGKRSFSQIAGADPPPAFSAAAAAGGEPSQAAAAAAAAAGGGATAQQQRQPLMVTIYFDGGSRGNPGRAGYGYAVLDRPTKQTLRIGCKPLPYGSTNNEAEYSGLIAGMRYAAEVLKAKHAVVLGDSQLAVRQMTGQYKVNGPRIIPLYREAVLLSQQFDSFDIQHVYREDNTLADQLSNLAMDTDAVVDQIAAGQGGTDRRSVARMLAAAAAVDQDASVVAELLTAPSFLQAAAALLGRIWDDTPQEEVLAELCARGWGEGTGGPPAAADGGGGGGGDDRRGGGGGGGGVAARRARPVAVAAVSLGPHWGAEIRRQEQQQLELEQQGAAGGVGGGLVGAAAAAVPGLLRAAAQPHAGPRGRQAHHQPLLLGAAEGAAGSCRGGGDGWGSSSSSRQPPGSGRLQEPARHHRSGVAGCARAPWGLLPATQQRQRGASPSLAVLPAEVAQNFQQQQQQQQWRQRHVRVQPPPSLLRGGGWGGGSRIGRLQTPVVAAAAASSAAPARLCVAAAAVSAAAATARAAGAPRPVRAALGVAALATVLDLPTRGRASRRHVLRQRV